MVCVGEDRPDHWIGWLEPLVLRAEHLINIGETVGACLEVADWSSFCESVGVEVGREHIEREMATGISYRGWIRSGARREVERDAKELLVRMEAELLQRIRDNDFDDVGGSSRELLHAANSRVAALESKVGDLEGRLRVAEANDTRMLDRACLELALAAWRGVEGPVVAGPLVLWSDRKVYALTQIGKEGLPAKSCPALLVEELEKQGVQVVRLWENTVVGGWISGPVYRQGPACARGWSQVWLGREKMTFVGASAEDAKQGEAIRQWLVGRTGGSE